MLANGHNNCHLGECGEELCFSTSSNVARSFAKTSKDEEVFDELELVTWPNPSDNYFNLKLKSNNIVDKVDIQVMDITGKRVHFNTFDSDLSYKFGERLQAGVYFVRITQGEFNKTLRVIKR